MDIDLLLMGRSCVDVVFTGMQKWPELGQEILASGMTVSGGGGFNVAAAATRVGLRVAYVSLVGGDLWGRFLLDQFMAEGVSTEWVQVLPGPLPYLSVALNLNGDRGFVTYGVEAPVAEAEMRARSLELLASGRVRHVHLTLEPGLTELVGVARRHGVTVSVDAWGYEPWLRSSDIRSLLPLGDVLFLNEPEALTITGAGDAATALARLKEVSQYVVVKQGPGGAVAAVGGRVIDIPTEPVSVEDATGAGDCFAAGFLYGWLRGNSPETCLTLGNICGGRSVMVAGGYRGCPREQELLALARTRGIISDEGEGSR